MRFGVHTHRTHCAVATDDRAAVARTVRQAAHHAVRPARLAFLPLENWHRRKPAVDPRDIGAVPGGSKYCSAKARSPPPGSTADIKVVRVIGSTAGAAGHGTAEPAPAS